MKEVNKRKGYVYILENENGLIKVGTSIQPRRRECQIVYISGYDIKTRYQTLLCWNPYKVEALAHKILQKKNKMSEWFLCTLEEAKEAVKMSYDLLAITEYNAPQPNYDWVEQIICEFYIKPYNPDYGLSDDDRIHKLEGFLETKINSRYFKSILESWEELDEYDEVDKLVIEYPNLSKGIDDSEEIKRLALETYSDLHYSTLCPYL